MSKREVVNKIYIKDLEDGNKFRLKTDLFTMENQVPDPYMLYTKEEAESFFTRLHKEGDIFELDKYDDTEAELKNDNSSISFGGFINGDTYELVSEEKEGDGEDAIR